ncbi:MAG: hypothetical protein JWP97_6579 [Labilithrix sp.]|nr:hypothetical protein [Labilithrix sp.]
MSDVARLHRLFADACFGASDPAVDTEAFLGRYDLAEEDAAALLASPRRLGLYRMLVRHNVVNVIGTMLDRTRARLDRRLPGRFDQAVAAFLAAQGPRTSHLRDVPGEFLAWAAPRWREDPAVPAWLVDYAEYELVEFTIGVAPRPPPPPPLADVTAERPLVFADPRTLVRLGHAVHLVPPDALDAEPEPRAVSLLVYRDAATFASRFLDLSPLAAAILEELFAGRALAAAMVAACEAAGVPLDGAVLGGAAQLLADLGERGVLLGARAD